MNTHNRGGVLGKEFFASVQPFFTLEILKFTRLKHRNNPFGEKNVYWRALPPSPVPLIRA